MAWDQVTTVSGRNEPLYFGPLSGYDTAELDRRGLDQDKKDTKGFKWFSKKDKVKHKKSPAAVSAWADPLIDNFEDKSTNENEETPTWGDFSQKTTFHGVRYIFNRSPYRIRRLLWSLVVFVAVGLFVGQVGTRVGVYFQHKSNVAVQVNYVETLRFPSVTICNQNNYRITSTVKWTLYDFIDSVYSVKNISNLDLSKYNLDVDTQEFVETTAHQKSDFIYRCEWQSNPCNITVDFNTVITDLGVCYTFNWRSPALTVTEPGSSTGLSLVLNVEQYEYMRGPQNDAGVKIHLHHQGEVPQMKDQGFAVAPGTHTLVGVKRTQITSLTRPYGSCEELNPVPVSECQLDCKSEKVYNVCGCHDVYMKQQKMGNLTSQVCDMEKKFTCVTLQMAQIRQEPLDCSCLVPCKRVRYEPSLSYAQLSTKNVERLIITTPEQRQQLQARFRAAMETSQRVVKETVDKDTTQITTLVDNMTHIVRILNESQRMFEDYQVYADKKKAVNMLSHEIIQADADKIESLIDSASSLAQVSVAPNLDYIYGYQVARTETAMVFEDNGLTSLTLQYLLFCNGSSNTEETTIKSSDEAAEQTAGTTPLYDVTSANNMTSHNTSQSTSVYLSNSTVAENKTNDTEAKFQTTVNTEETTFIDDKNNNTTPSVSPDTTSEAVPSSSSSSLSNDTSSTNVTDDPSVLATTACANNSTVNDTTNNNCTDLSLTTTTEDNRLSNTETDMGGAEQTHEQSWVNIQSRDECETVFENLKNEITDVGYIEDDLNYMNENDVEKQFEKYRENIEMLFRNASFNITGVEDHVECLALELNITTIENLLAHIFKLAANVTYSKTYDEAYGYAVQIPALYREILQYDQNTFLEKEISLSKICGWLKAYASEALKEKDTIAEDFTQVLDSSDAALRQFKNLDELFHSLHNDVIMKVEPTILMGSDYLNVNFSKVKLAEEFSKPYFSKAFQDVADLNAELTEVTKDYKEELSKAQDKLLATYDAVLALKLPVINKENVFELELVKAASKIDDPQMRELVKGLQTGDLKENLKGLVEEAYNRLMDPTAEFSEPVNNLIQQIETLVEDLETYKKSATMNTDFFMENFIHVDIFYQELSYEEIQQNIAFEFLSLLSEIGGFLGLLLGASVLTVCELLDYMSLAFLNKLQSQTKVAPVHYGNT